MRHVLLMSLLLSAAAGPAPAFAQGDPFGPLPQTPQPPPQQPAPQPVERDSDDDGLGGRAFWFIVGSTALLFAGIAFVIGRDMRRTVGARGKGRRKRGRRPAAAAADALAEPEPRHLTGSQKARAKAQKRAKTKAARKQRRKQRSR